METSVEKSGAFVASQFVTPRPLPAASRSARAGPAVTIAHQSGAGAQEIAEGLAEILQATEPAGPLRWTVVNRQLVEKALEEHHWPKHLARKMPEDKRSYLDDVLDDLFGLRPPSWVLVPQVVETMLHLATTGHVILIGRGATLATAPIPNVFRVRVVAALASRIARVQRALGLTAAAAAERVRKEDRGRQRYVAAYFHARLEDELLYDLIINTDRVPCPEAARLIADAARRRFQSASRSALAEPPGAVWRLAGS